MPLGRFDSRLDEISLVLREQRDTQIAGAKRTLIDQAEKGYLTVVNGVDSPCTAELIPCGIVLTIDTQLCLVTREAAENLAKQIQGILWKEAGRCPVCGDYMHNDTCTGVPH